MDTQTVPATLLVASCASGNTRHHLSDYGSPTAGAVALFYAYDNNGAPLSLSATHTVSCSGTSYGSVVAQALSGTLSGSDPYDLPNQNGSSGTSQHPQPGSSGAPSQPNSLLVAAVGGNITSFSIDSGFAVADHVNYGVSQGSGAGVAGLQRGAEP
jgi:hypothetical protein